MEMRVLNLIHDDKFFDGLITEYDYFGVNSRFVILQSGSLTELRYIKSLDRVQRVLIASAEYYQLIDDRDYDVVWVHYWDGAKQNLVKSIHAIHGCRVVIIWSSWGSDLYNALNMNVFGWRTFLLALAAKNWRQRCGFVLHSGLGFLGINRSKYSSSLRQALSAVDCVSTIIPGEYRYVRKLLGRDIKWIWFCYGTLPAVEMVNEVASLESTCVWLGNSATFSNNHIEAIVLLRKLLNYSVIAPLSYGDARLEIDKVGRWYLGQRWRPINDFMPFSEYRRIMSRCSVFVFPHKRQQAFGNILLALKMGGCVFLDFRNPIADFLLSKGVKVFSIKELIHLQECLESFKKIQGRNIAASREIFSENDVISILGSAFKEVKELVLQRRSRNEVKEVRYD